MGVYNLLWFTELSRSSKISSYLPTHKRQHTRKPMFQTTAVLRNSKLRRRDSVNVTGLFVDHL